MPGTDAAPPAVAAPAGPADAPTTSLFAPGNFVMPGTTPPAAPAAQMIGNRVLDPSEVTPGAAQAVTAATPNPGRLASTLRDIRIALDPTTAIPAVASDVAGHVRDSFTSARDMAGSGISDLREGRAFGNMDMQGNGSAGGVLKTLGGALGVLPPVAAVSGVASALGDLATNTTGNPDFGNKVSLVAATAAPGGGSLSALKVIPEAKAIGQLVRDIGDENIPTVIAALKSNPRLAPMDVAPVVQSSVMGLASDPASGAQTVLSDVVNNRITGAKGSMKAAADEALGPPPNVAKTLADLKAKAQETGKTLIEPAVEAAKYVDVTDIVNRLDKQFDPAVLKSLKAGETPAMPMSDPAKRLWELRQQIRGDLPDQFPGATDRMFMFGDDAHELQKKLRQMGGDPQVGYEARSVRRQLVDAIDQASGGAAAEGGGYRAALKQYADDKQVAAAFEKGHGIFQNSGKLEDHPDLWAAWAEDASANELEAARQGAAIAADAKIRNMRSGLDVPNDSFAADKLSSIVSKPIADRLVSALNDERTIAGTNSKLFQNSQTARRLLGAENRQVPKPDPFRPLSVNALAGPIAAALAEGVGETYLSTFPGAMSGAILGSAAAMGLAKKGFQKAQQQSALATNASYARLAAGADPLDRNAVIAALGARQKLISKGQKGRNALSIP